MAEAEIFDPDDRVELLDGKVFDLAPIGSRHAACVKRLARLFMTLGEHEAVIGIQDPIQVGEHSEPQPDLALLRPRADYYATGHPAPDDIFLVVEVGDVTAPFDRTAKLSLYLAGGIPEVWVVDLVADVVHVATPATRRSVGRGESIAPEAFPDLVLEVAAIVG